MADRTRPLLVVAGDAAGICDPETGTCAVPEATDEAGRPAGAVTPG